MPLSARTISATTRPVLHQTDERWLMAYAASLGDLNPHYMDTTQAITAHPVFPVCLEWPAILATRELTSASGMTDSESSKGVHASHDLHLYRSIVPGELLATTTTIIDARSIPPGAALVMRLDTLDEQGELVCRTYQTSIYRGVSVSAETTEQMTDAPPAWPNSDSSFVATARHNIAIPGNLAHSYTECARIFNPIHTDKQVALDAGLPDIILHGTATLALAVSTLVDQCLDGNPKRVSRLGGRFSAMVLMPSEIALEIGEAKNGNISFRVFNEHGEEAISRGFLSFT